MDTCTFSHGYLNKFPCANSRGAVQSSNSDAKQVSWRASLFFCRVMEMPYAYQCCAFGACESHYKISSQWNKDENNSIDDFHRKDAGLLQIQGNHPL